MNRCYWLNSAWMLSCRWAWREFQRGCQTVEATQTALLRRLVRANCDSEIGRRWKFDRIDSVKAFQRRVPLTTYDDYRPWIDRVCRGEKQVLTADRVRLLQPTSGSAGNEKWIPYTASLHKQFQRAIDVWIADLMQHHPRIRGGTAYWSISPAGQETRTTRGGIPVGFADDTEYLNRWQRWAVTRLLAVPSLVARSTNMENFRYLTLLYLLRARDLALLSVWSPTFLTALLSGVSQWGNALCRDIADGTITLPFPESEDPFGQEIGPLAPCPARAEVVQAAIGSGGWDGTAAGRIWPRLTLISCWTDATAGRFVGKLRGCFPDVAIQPKGLLSTEAFVSIPLIAQRAPALAVCSHFFEFRPVDEPDRCCLAEQLRPGSQYRVVVTTAGGLYRYQTGDIIRVEGFWQRCPLIRFVGRGDLQSDLVGEKLSEVHVQAAIEATCRRARLNPDFSLVVPLVEPRPGYRLYMQLADDDGTGLEYLQSELEMQLRANPYYRHAVAGGQLQPIQIRLFPATAPLWRLYERRCLQQGQKCGDIKPVALHPALDWPDVFDHLTTNAVSRTLESAGKEWRGDARGT